MVGNVTSTRVRQKQDVWDAVKGTSMSNSRLNVGALLTAIVQALRVHVWS